jgi:hypothetical protein
MTRIESTFDIQIFLGHLLSPEFLVCAANGFFWPEQAPLGCREMRKISRQTSDWGLGATS